MGLFRLILAISVMLAHIAETFGKDSTLLTRESLHILAWSGHAVFAFFIISGFYITMILHERYSQLANGKVSFYLNRALRIYPVHFAILAIYAAIYLASGQPFFLLGDWPVEAIGNKIHAIFSNLFLFGVEILPMLNHANWQLVIGPTWSLSLELYFYLLAPFIVLLRLRWFLFLTVTAFALRMGLLIADLPMVQWRYFFFPADMVFFLLGAISYRVFTGHLCARVRRHKTIQVIAAVVIGACIITPPLWSVGGLDSINAWIFYGCVTLCIPFLFELTKNWKADRLLGHLAYPVYLSHMAVVAFIVHINPFPETDKGMLVFILTFLLSIALYYGIDRHVEIIRQRIKGRGVGKNHTLGGLAYISRASRAS